MLISPHSCLRNKAKVVPRLRLIVFFLRAAALMMYTTSLCSFHTTGFNIGLISQFSLGNHIYIIHRGDFLETSSATHLLLGGNWGTPNLVICRLGWGKGVFYSFSWGERALFLLSQFRLFFYALQF